MVTVPGIENSLALTIRYAPCLVERGLGVVGLAECMLVQGLKVNGASRLAVLLCADHHAVTPCHRRTDGYLLQHAEANVLVEACLNLVLPVDGHRDGGVTGHWRCILAKHKAERRAGHSR